MFLEKGCTSSLEIFREGLQPFPGGKEGFNEIEWWIMVEIESKCWDTGIEIYYRSCIWWKLKKNYETKLIWKNRTICANNQMYDQNSSNDWTNNEFEEGKNTGAENWHLIKNKINDAFLTFLVWDEYP